MRHGLKAEKPSKCPAPQFEAWKLVGGAKGTGRVKMAETGELIISLKNFVVTRQFLDS